MLNNVAFKIKAQYKYYFQKRSVHFKYYLHFIYKIIKFLDYYPHFDLTEETKAQNS